MKLFQLLIPIALLSLFAFSSCQSSESKNVMEEARNSLPQSTETNAADNAASPVMSNPGTNASVPHYKCPENCEGGVGDAAGNCPVCGTALAHNAAYHNQPGNTPDATANPQTPPAQQPSPAQNAAGVYHYTCSNGCKGGAASATACGSCGATLVHNSAYHN